MLKLKLAVIALRNKALKKTSRIVRKTICD
jgi:hypothetical protein